MPSVVPVSTYRLQLRAEFGFAAAAEVVPYLARLGVTHVYCSPVLQATPGSVHGYDVVDHSILSRDLGGDEAWTQFVAACREHGLGIVVDVVPNHMAIPAPESLNPALWAALAAGPGSPAADWLDVDWAAEDGRILLPVLGQPLGDAIAAGEVTIDAGEGVVRYFDHVFPLAAGTTADDRTHDADQVEDVLARQHYRLVGWRVANTRLNYRRFFDVTSLLGVRVELPEVFLATHARLLRLVEDGEVDCLRIDHPDGLADPGGYLDRLADATGGRWTVVEKILEPGESLPSSWRCAGTTGYDALGAITNVFVDPGGCEPLDQIWRRRVGEPLASWERVVAEAKRLIVTGTFEAEVRRLARCAGAAGFPPSRGFRAKSAPDHTEKLDQVAAAVRELLIAFDVYRAYPESRARLDAAAERAAARQPRLAGTIRSLRALAAVPGEFATRLAQTTGPVMAKGVEDTALYRFHRLVALNEVGGDPGVFGRPVTDFHDFCSDLARDWPQSMTTLSTHDTKRSEDVRARLAVLPEIPSQWDGAVTQWDAETTSAEWPELDSATRYLIWQTLVGAWPLSTERLSAYLEKATREAKLHTSWTDPDPSYDERVQAFVVKLSDSGVAARIGRWAEEHIVGPGLSNSLGQKLVQLTMPGVPDIYQGCERIDLSLVDPDNRRAVNFEHLQQRLDAAEEAEDPKLRVVQAALRLRRDRPDTFLNGGYRPLEAAGPAAAHAMGFTRGDDVATVVTRLPVTLRARGGWDDETRLELPGGEWRDVLTNRQVSGGPLSDLLGRSPVALLVRERG